ncbi:MAG: PIN domain-containing protein [Hydrogenothermaceae bacterium]|nr:PIN domain-containing protein [Hydrogenothermaceae bacterium]
MGYLIDTDIIIDFLKGREDIVKLLNELLEKYNCYISILTYYELLMGAYSKKQKDTIEELSNLINIINIDKKIVKIAAEFYRNYRKIGITLPDIDCLIMATAKVKNLKIVTRNIKHYPEINLLSEYSKSLIKN